MNYYLSTCHNNIHKSHYYHKHLVGEVAKCLFPDGTELPLVVGETYRVYFHRSHMLSDYLVAFYPHIEGVDDDEPNGNSLWYKGEEYLDYLYSEVSMNRDKRIKELGI